MLGLEESKEEEEEEKEERRRRRWRRRRVELVIAEAVCHLTSDHQLKLEVLQVAVQYTVIRSVGTGLTHTCVCVPVSGSAQWGQGEQHVHTSGGSHEDGTVHYGAILEESC